jgi:hypothetical protein
MKLPEPLFLVINPVVRFLLRSPLHRVVSDSLMLITFTGRNSGRRFTTPVRYVRRDDKVRCFTSAENQWWRNLRGGADVTLTVRGQERPYRAVAITDDPALIGEALRDYLGEFPQDAAYHEIRLDKHRRLVREDLERAATRAVVVEATPV